MPETRVTESVLRRALTLDERGFTRPALDLLEIELNNAPDQGRLWELRGLLLAKLRDFTKAITALETASLLVPLHQDTLVAWAESYSAAGQHRLALDLYEHLFEQRNLPDELLPRLASGFARSGRTHRAVEVCRESVRREPDCDPALFGLAYYMLRQGDSPQRVLPLIRKAIKLAPHCCLYRLTLIRLLQHANDPDGAYDALKEIPVSKLTTLRCGCCLKRLLDLCIEQEDYDLASMLVARLSALGHASESCS